MCYTQNLIIGRLYLIRNFHCCSGENSGRGQVVQGLTLATCPLYLLLFLLYTCTSPPLWQLTLAPAWLQPMLALTPAPVQWQWQEVFPTLFGGRRTTYFWITVNTVKNPWAIPYMETSVDHLGKDNALFWQKARLAVALLFLLWVPSLDRKRNSSHNMTALAHKVSEWTTAL